MFCTRIHLVPLTNANPLNTTATERYHFPRNIACKPQYARPLILEDVQFLSITRLTGGDEVVNWSEMSLNDAAQQPDQVECLTKRFYAQNKR